MGIDISSSLLVGAYYEDLEEWPNGKVEADWDEDGEDVQELLDEFFICASPYFDADIEDRFYGLAIKNNCAITEEWIAEVKEAARMFEALTGVKPIIRGGVNVW